MIKKPAQLIALPTQRSKPETKLSAYSILLYGQEKIGKTSFTAQFPKPLHLMFEPGGKSLELYKEDIKDWAHFRKLLPAIEHDKTFENVVVDTADVAYIMNERWVCEANGVTDIQDMEFGKGWRKNALEFHTCVRRLIKTGKGVIFTSHVSEKQFKRRGGESTDRIVPSMSKQAREILEPIVDIWTYYRYTPGGGREFVIRGDEEISAGVRTKGHFVGIDKIPAGRSEEEAYHNFLNAFNNRLTGTGMVDPKLKKSQFKFNIKK